MRAIQLLPGDRAEHPAIPTLLLARPYVREHGILLQLLRAQLSLGRRLRQVQQLSRACQQRTLLLPVSVREPVEAWVCG